MSTPVEALLAELTSDRPDARRRAAETLAQLGERAAAAAVSLVEAAGDKDEQVREWAVAALEGLGPPPVHRSADLMRRLDHPQPDVAYWAATLLGRLDAAARSAIAPLTQLLRTSPHLAVRQRGAWALGRILATASRHDLEPAVRAETEAGLKDAIVSRDPRLARLAQEALNHLLAAR